MPFPSDLGDGGEGRGGGGRRRRGRGEGVGVGKEREWDRGGKGNGERVGSGNGVEVRKRRECEGGEENRYHDESICYKLVCIIDMHTLHSKLCMHAITVIAYRPKVRLYCSLNTFRNTQSLTALRAASVQLSLYS